MYKQSRTSNSIYYKTIVVIWAIFFLITLYIQFKNLYYVKELYLLKKQVINSPCIPLELNNNKIVHINCLVKNEHKFTIPSEFSANLNTFYGLFLDTVVEIYQKKYGSLGKGYWSTQLKNTFNSPKYIPYVPGHGRKFAKSIEAGAFHIDGKAISQLDQKIQLELHDDGIYERSSERTPVEINSKNTQVYNNALYTGNPYSPEEGDIRIKFFGSNVNHVSCIGLQAKLNLWNEFKLQDSSKNLYPIKDSFKTKNIYILSSGELTSDELLNTWVKQIDPYNIYIKPFLIIVSILSTIIIWVIIVEYNEFHGKQISKIFVLMLSILYALCSLLVISIICIFNYDTFKAVGQLLGLCIILCLTIILHRTCNKSISVDINIPLSAETENYAVI